HCRIDERAFAQFFEDIECCPGLASAGCHLKNAMPRFQEDRRSVALMPPTVDCRMDRRRSRIGSRRAYRESDQVSANSFGKVIDPQVGVTVFPYFVEAVLLIGDSLGLATVDPRVIDADRFVV